jgi:hypothetical protein
MREDTGRVSVPERVAARAGSEEVSRRALTPSTPIAARER